jgi:predicted outer membrane repeat protein
MRAPTRPALEILEDRCTPATLTVNTTADTTQSGLLSLRDALDVVNGGFPAFSALPIAEQSQVDTTQPLGTNDTIQFDPGVFNGSQGAILLSGSELEVSASVSIDGTANGARNVTISGNSASRIFNINSGWGTVSISSLTITGGAVDGVNGAGVLIQDSVVSFTDCVFSDNVVTTGLGGAIEAVTLSGTIPLTITDCTFSNNSATDNGGAIDSPGANLTISGSTFNGNSGGNGGALSIGTGTVTITDSTFFDNHAATNGGAINSNFGAIFDLVNTTISGNSAGFGGGGIAAAPFTMTYLANTIVAGNTAGLGPDIYGTVASQGHNLIGNTSFASGFVASDLLGVPAGLDPNGLQHNGGPTQTIGLVPGSLAIDAGDNTLLALNSLLTDQRGVGLPVGSIVDIGAYEYIPSIVVTSTGDGAGTLSVVGGVVYDTTLRGALAYIGSGGTITFQAGVTGTLPLTDGELSIARPVTIQGPGAGVLTIDAHNASRIFDIVSLTPGLVNISGLTLTGGNTSRASGNLAGGAILSDVATLNLSDMVITGNHSADVGGGVVNHGSLTILNSTLSFNTADVDGGGVYFASSSELTIQDSTFSYNTGRSGGAGYFAGGTQTITGSTFDHNQAFFGGAIFSTTGSLVMQDSTVARNASSGNGGGVLLFDGTAVIQDSTIAGNTASGTGGGINNSAATVSLTNSIVAGNSAGNDNDVAGPVTANYNLIQDTTGATFLAGSGNNITGRDPLLGALQDNGGPTQTMALLPGSPASDAGSNALIPPGVTTDQRGAGFARILGPAVDIGAFEAPTVALSVLDFNKHLNFGHFTGAIHGTATPGVLIELNVLDNHPNGQMSGWHFTTAAKDGTWSFSGLDLSNLGDGYIDYHVYAIDSSGYYAYVGSVTTISHVIDAVVILPPIFPAFVGAPIPILVQLRDAFGNVISTSLPVALASSASDLGGVSQVTTNSAGLAFFNDVIFALTGIHSITAFGAGLTPTTSGTFNVSNPFARVG